MTAAAWVFVLASWFTAPWGTGGWYAQTMGPFADEAECREAARWVASTLAPKPIHVSRCYRAAAGPVAPTADLTSTTELDRLREAIRNPESRRSAPSP